MMQKKLTYRLNETQIVPIQSLIRHDACEETCCWQFNSSRSHQVLVQLTPEHEGEHQTQIKSPWLAETS